MFTNVSMARGKLLSCSLYLTVLGATTSEFLRPKTRGAHAFAAAMVTTFKPRKCDPAPLLLSFFNHHYSDGTVLLWFRDVL